MIWKKYFYTAPFKLYKREHRTWTSEEFVKDQDGDDALVSRQRGYKTLQIFWWCWTEKIKYEGEE